MVNPNRFKGKSVIVTGAAQGIGFATAQAFVAEGASVLLADLSEAVEESARVLGEMGGDTRAFRLDVADINSCEEMVTAALDHFGQLDFAFNNAGVTGRFTHISDLAVEEWNRVIQVNLSGVFNCIKYQLPAMVAQGGGVIVNNSSVLGLRAFPETSIEYTAAKHGVIGLTRQVAVNHAAEGIRCVAVCPGFTVTNLTSETLDEEMRQWFLARTPQARMGEPDDIARAVLMLCSEDSRFVNGQAIAVDGGLVHG